MANVSRRNGFRPVKSVNGSPWNGQVNRYFAAAGDAVAIFNGDLVSLAAVTDAAGTQGVAKGSIAANTAYVGVAVGFQINPLNLNSPQYRIASTAMYVLVADDPETIFEVQSEVGSPPATDLNTNAQVADGGGSTVTGISGQYVTSYNNTATTSLKVMGAVQKVDNDLTSVNYKILVKINNHQYNGTGTAGV